MYWEESTAKVSGLTIISNDYEFDARLQQGAKCALVVDFIQIRPISTGSCSNAVRLKCEDLAGWRRHHASQPNHINGTRMATCCNETPAAPLR